MYQDLIVVIVDKYLSEDVMKAAKHSGARGGTILQGRTFSPKEQKKLFNIIVEPEKEIILILSKEEETQNIVSSIDEKLNISTNNQGVIFVLDVLGTIG